MPSTQTGDAEMYSVVGDNCVNINVTNDEYMNEHQREPLEHNDTVTLQGEPLADNNTVTHQRESLEQNLNIRNDHELSNSVRQRSIINRSDNDHHECADGEQSPECETNENKPEDNLKVIAWHDLIIRHVNVEAMFLV